MFNYKEYLEKQKSHARRCFQNHKATFDKYGGKDGIEVLEWRDKKGDIYYRIRYVFDKKGNTLTITGDLGSAVVCPTWDATLEDFVRVAPSPDYFLEKIKCSSDRWDYNSHQAEEDVRERLKESLDEMNLTDSRERDFEYDLMCVMESFSSFNGWQNIDSHAREILNKYDPEWHEWLFSCGQRIHPRVICWLVGIQMAWEQIYGDKKNEE